MTLEWKEPPPARPRGPKGVDWDAVVAELVRHPDQWAVVRHDIARSNANHTLTRLRFGRFATLPPTGSLEAKFVAMNEVGASTRRGDVYARYRSTP